MKILTRIVGVIILTLVLVILGSNILYWGFIFLGGLLGIWAYPVVGVIILLMIIGYARLLKVLIKK